MKTSWQVLSGRREEWESKKNERSWLLLGQSSRETISGVLGHETPNICVRLWRLRDKLWIMCNGCETCPTVVGGNRSRLQRKREQEASGMLEKGEERDLQRFQKVKDKRQFVMTSTKGTCSDCVIKSWKVLVHFEETPPLNKVILRVPKASSLIENHMMVFNLTVLSSVEGQDVNSKSRWLTCAFSEGCREYWSFIRALEHGWRSLFYEKIAFYPLGKYLLSASYVLGSMLPPGRHMDICDFVLEI